MGTSIRTELPSRFMRASVDSIESTVRPFTFSLARSSSSAGTGSSCRRRSCSPMIPIASPTLSRRVPTYTPTCPMSMKLLA